MDPAPAESRPPQRPRGERKAGRYGRHGRLRGASPGSPGPARAALKPIDIFKRMRPRSVQLSVPRLAERRRLDEHIEKLGALRREGAAGARVPPAPRPPPNYPPGQEVEEGERRKIDRVLAECSPASGGADRLRAEDAAEAAAAAGDTALLRQCLLCISERQRSTLRQARRSLVHLAALGGHVAPCVLLIAEFGFSPGTMWPGHGTPLHIAAACGHSAIVAYLLTFDDAISGVNAAEPQTRDRPLHLAALYGEVESLRLLVNAGAVSDPVNEDGASPLLIACREGHGDFARAMLADNTQVIDLDRCDAARLPSTYYCIRNGDLPLLRALVTAGAAVSNPRLYWDPVAYTAHFAPPEAALNIARYLVEECGLRPNCPNGKQNTPLTHAEARGLADLQEYLKPFAQRR